MPDNSEVVAGIVDNVRRVFQVVNELSKRAERETGLTGPQLWAIKTIAERAPVRVSDIAEHMYLHPATVVGILDRLEARGLAVRTRSTADRRVVMVDLSAKGKELVKNAPAVAQGLLVSGLEQLSLQRLGRISDGLEQLVDILGAQRVPPQLILSPEVNKPRRADVPAKKRSAPR